MFQQASTLLSSSQSASGDGLNCRGLNKGEESRGLLQLQLHFNLTLFYRCNCMFDLIVLCYRSSLKIYSHAGKGPPFLGDYSWLLCHARKQEHSSVLATVVRTQHMIRLITRAA